MKKYLFALLFLILTSSTALATNYYVKPSASGGSDSNTGLSDAQAWATVSKVNGFSFSTGDDVYFLCGGVWSNAQLIVDWSGNSGNDVIVGAYHLESGSPVLTVSGAKPQFLGTNWNGTTSYPSTEGTPLISASNTSYVTIQDIEVKNSGGHGIIAGGSWDTRLSAYGNTHIKRCTLTHIDGSGIVFVYQNWDAVDYGNVTPNPANVQGGDGRSSIEDNYIYETCQTTHYSYDHGLGITSNWGKNVKISGNTLIKNNGEGIGVYENSPPATYNSHHGYTTIENNIVYASRRASIFVGSSEGCIIRYNLVYNDQSSTTYSTTVVDGRRYAAEGICIGEETGYPCDYGNLNNNHAYGNFVSGASAGLTLSFWGDGTETRSVSNGNKFFNNTIVGTANCIAINFPANLAVERGTDNAFENNICWNPDPTTNQRMLYGTTVMPSSGVTINYNLWATTPEVSGFIGANDPSRGAPTLQRMTGWTNITSPMLTRDDFKLQTGSRGLDVGATLGSPWNSDYWGTSRPAGAAYDIGAYEYPAAGSAPSTPANLAVTAHDTSTVSLSWSASSGATGYRIYRQTGAGAYTLSLDTTGLEGTIYGLEPGTSWNFKVSAYNTAYGESAQSTLVNQSTDAFVRGDLINDNCTSFTPWTKRSDGAGILYEIVTGAEMHMSDANDTLYSALSLTTPPTVPAEFTVDYNATMTNLVTETTDVAAGLMRQQGWAVNNGRAFMSFWLSNDGIYTYKDGSTTLVPGSSALVDTANHKWTALVKYSSGTSPFVVDFYKDGAATPWKTGYECGVMTDYPGAFLDNFGSVADPSEMTIKSFQISKGLQPPTGPPISPTAPSMSSITTSNITGVFHYTIEYPIIVVNFDRSVSSRVGSAQGASCAMKLNFSTGGSCLASVHESNVLSCGYVVRKNDPVTSALSVTSIEAGDAGCNFFSQDGGNPLAAFTLPSDVFWTSKSLTVLPSFPSNIMY